jgi:hypothetical protein
LSPFAYSFLCHFVSSFPYLSFLLRYGCSHFSFTTSYIIALGMFSVKWQTAGSFPGSESAEAWSKGRPSL